MSKSNVLSFAATIGNSQGDTNELDKTYDRVSTILALSPWNIQAELVTVTKDTSQYTLDEDVGNILYVFYDNRALALESIDTIQLFSYKWRDVVGTPFAYVREQEDSKVIRLFPNPDKSSADFAFVFGEGFGIDYPENAIVTIHTRRKVDWAEQFDLPLTFEVLAEEFSRESEHKDINFANTCRSFAELILGVL